MKTIDNFSSFIKVHREVEVCIIAECWSALEDIFNDYAYSIDLAHMSNLKVSLRKKYMAFVLLYKYRPELSFKINEYTTKSFLRWAIELNDLPMIEKLYESGVPLEIEKNLEYIADKNILRFFLNKLQHKLNSQQIVGILKKVSSNSIEDIFLELTYEDLDLDKDYVYEIYVNLLVKNKYKLFEIMSIFFNKLWIDCGLDVEASERELFKSVAILIRGRAISDFVEPINFEQFVKYLVSSGKVRYMLEDWVDPSSNMTKLNYIFRMFHRNKFKGVDKNLIARDGPVFETIFNWYDDPRLELIFSKFKEYPEISFFESCVFICDGSFEYLIDYDEDHAMKAVKSIRKKMDLFGLNIDACENEKLKMYLLKYFMEFNGDDVVSGEVRKI